MLARFREWVAARPRNLKKIFLILYDVVVLLLMVWLAFCFRLNALFVPNSEQTLIMLAAPMIAIPIFIRMGLYRSVLRYLPERAIWTILQSVTVSVLVWVTLAFLTQMTGAAGIPRSVPIVYWTLSVLVIAGSRFGAKWLLWSPLRQQLMSKQTLIYGAGDAGTQLASALRATNDRFVAGFVSEDHSLHGMDILGIRVYPPSDIPSVVSNFGIDEVIITTRATNAAKRRDLIAQLGALPVKIRILPAIADLAAGKYLVSYVRDIDIDDLLGRSPVPANPVLLREMIEGRTILITGAAGSIGSALSRTVADFGPAVLILMDFNEHGLYEISRELHKKSNAKVVSVLGSVTDRGLVERTLQKHHVRTVYHCAAYKHVSLVETNQLEGIRNNVVGAEILAEAASRCGVENFILISSDKAVRPSSVMGATKRWAELIVRHYGALPDPEGRTRNFASVRFGNVIGSSGSVVPLFKEQIAAGGPVTITDENMTRYFMSVREAAELIVQASALSDSGDILLLEMGEPIRIRDLAEDMIILAGLSVRDEANPDGDIEIVTIGARQGEKLHEELFYDPTGVTATSHPKILRAKRANGSTGNMPEMVAKLVDAIGSEDAAQARALLFDFIAP